MYGSVSPPGIPYGENDMVNIVPIGKVDCANPTSEDERQYREMMEDELLLAQPDFMQDISGMDEVGFRGESPTVSSPAKEQEDIRSSSVFEEAQRPPWLGCTIGFTGSVYDQARGSSESSDDEVVRPISVPAYIPWKYRLTELRPLHPDSCHTPGMGGESWITAIYTTTSRGVLVASSCM